MSHFNGLHLNQTSDSDFSLFSLGEFNQIVTVGEDPWLQFNLPYNVQLPDLKEVTENVVSTVKSGLARMLWGGGGGGNEGEEVKRSINSAFGCNI